MGTQDPRGRRGGPVWRGRDGADAPKRGGPIWRGPSQQEPPSPSAPPLLPGTRSFGPPGEVILEFRSHGHIVKVSAVDPVTLTEVSLQAPATTSREELEQAAVAKLNYVLAKRRGGR